MMELNVDDARLLFRPVASWTSNACSLTAYEEAWDERKSLPFESGQAVLTYQIGTSFPMRRRIEAPIGGNSMAILGDIENIGTSATERMILYHTNLGFLALGQNTTVALNGLNDLQALKLG